MSPELPLSRRILQTLEYPPIREYSLELLIIYGNTHAADFAFDEGGGGGGGGGGGLSHASPKPL